MNPAFTQVKEKVKSPIGIFILCMCVAIFSSFATYSLSSHYFSNQFRVLYSLDKKQHDKEIISLIDNADRYVYFAIYFFTKENIADALIRAHKRGLVVWGIVDRESSTGASKTVVDKLREAGIPVETQKHGDGIMHIKAVVTEKAYASGSYNWTGSATTVNDEILEIGTQHAVRKKYLSIVQKILIENE